MCKHKPFIFLQKFVSVAGPTKYENSVLLGYVNKVFI